MLIDWLYQIKDSIDKHGIRFGLIFAIYAIYRKERRNLRLDKRDDDMYHNQRIIMQQLGVLDQWRGPQKKLLQRDLLRSTKLYLSLHRVIKQVYQSRRKKKMNKLKSRKLWMALLAAVLPIINQEFNLGLDTTTIVAAIGGIVSYIVGQAHVDAKAAQNGGTINESTQSTNTIGNNK